MRMSRVACSVPIAARPTEVWEVLVDVEHWPLWASQFKGIERLDAAPLAQGSRVRVRPKGMLASTWRVTEFEEGRSFTWKSSVGPGLVVTGGHVLSADGTSVRAEFWLDATGPIGSIVAPLLRGTVFRRNTRNAAEGLKRYVEGRR